MSKPNKKRTITSSNPSTIRLENWSLICDQDPYRAPELLSRYLHGNCFGHPRHDDGKPIQTSRILSVKGNIVTTKSGSVYELGKISESYLSWIKDNNLTYDENNPIKLI